MKLCNRCQEHKPSTDFYAKPQAKDGLFWWCKPCHRERMRSAYRALAADPAYRKKESLRVSAHNAQNADKRALRDKVYVANNRHKVNAKLRKRYASKMQRTPAWLSEDDLWLMEQAYELADIRTKLFGFVWHVDHVIPLQGTLVSGLHVPHNLQVVPALENRRKSNRFIPT